METVKKRIKLTVAYDGTNYCGWQVQPNGNTIEAELDRAIFALLKEKVHVIGASRTDSGVHALGNVAVFDTAARMNASRMSFALNTYLPEDIRIRGSEEVPLSWHPRYQETIKTYRYQILNSTFPDPTCRLYSMFYHYPLDERRMQEAADALVGTHDFTSFCTLQPNVTDRVRTIYSLDVQRQDEMITITVKGNGFLYNMVRIITGTLIRIGGGLMEPGQMKEILGAKDRQMAAETARPEGLTLVSIVYPRDGSSEP